MERIIIDLEAKTDRALKGISEVKSQLNQLNTEATKQNKGVEKSFNKVEIATKTVSKGIKAIGTTLKAIGIGLLISSLATLKELFSQNQKVVDAFNIIFETSAEIVGQVATAFTDTYNALTQSTDQLDALGKVASGILTIALSPLKLGFYGISLAIDEAMLAWEKSFLGDKDPETIKALNLSILETKKNIVEVAEATSQAGSVVVNNFAEAITEVSEIGKVVVKEFGEVSISTATEAAKANVELQKSAELAAERQGLFFEKFDRQAEKLRQIRDDETKSIEERKQANDELLIKLDSAESEMLSQAQMQLALADANLKKDKENVEFQTARIEALRELAGVEAQIEGVRSEQKSNSLALDRESLELTNSQKEADAELNANKNQFEAEQIENDLARLERQKLLNEEETKSEVKRLTDKRNLYKKGTIAFQEAQKELNAYQQASGQKQVLIEKQIAKEKEKTVLNTLGAIAGLLGSNSKFGKALAITQALRDTYAGANKALAQGGIFGFIGAAGVIASGIANVKQITSSKEPATPSFATGGGGSPVSTPPTPSVSSVPPAFNVVGASDTNQLAEAIGSQSQQPIQAYVVSNDVSTAQEMDRNIIEGASIG
jgi:hypothetical protein